MSFRPRTKTAYNDSAGSALAGQTLQTAGLTGASINPKGDYFGFAIDVSGVSGESVTLVVQHSEDGGATWGAYPAALGATASANAQAALPAITANGHYSGFWYNFAGLGNPNGLVRAFLDIDTSQCTIDSIYFIEGSLGGR